MKLALYALLGLLIIGLYYALRFKDEVFNPDPDEDIFKR